MKYINFVSISGTTPKQFKTPKSVSRAVAIDDEVAVSPDLFSSQAVPATQVQEETPRRRGRPSKAAKTPRSTRKRTSSVALAEDEEYDAVAIGEEPTPSRRRRGRPSKGAAAVEESPALSIGRASKITSTPMNAAGTPRRGRPSKTPRLPQIAEGELNKAAVAAETPAR